MRNLLLPEAHHGVFLPATATAAAPRVHRNHVLVVSGARCAVGIRCGGGGGGIVWIVVVVAVRARGAQGAVGVLDVVRVGGVEFGFRVVEGGFGGFVVVAVGGLVGGGVDGVG